jgi:hypothetical protein
MRDVCGRPPYGALDEPHLAVAICVANYLGAQAASGRLNADSLGKHCTAIATAFRNSPRAFDPTERARFPFVRDLLDGFARRHPVVPARKAPVTIEMLDRMRAGCRSTDDVTRAGVVILTFFRALRGGETVPDSAGAYDPLVHLAFGSVVRPSPRLIQVMIKQRKTRQPGVAGGAATLLNLRPSASRDVLDPFWWMERQLDARTRVGASANDPFFADQLGRAVTRPQVEERLRAAAEGADVTLHSPRIGIVNYMRAAGYSVDDIREWGGWSSDAVYTYFRGGAQERLYPAPGSLPDMNDIVGAVVALRGQVVCPGWGVHDDIFAGLY